MVKNITNLDSSKASGPDCIQVVILKNCVPELSYILAELFSLFNPRRQSAVGNYRRKCQHDLIFSTFTSAKNCQILFYLTFF